MADYIPRSLNPPQGSCFLLGPRGTGKSTWLLHQYPEAVRIDLLLGEEERRFSAYPERIRDVARGLPSGSILILDEIQRVPQLLPEIHALIEEKRGIQYILTGSGARKLRKSVSDLLGGRALLRQMGPFLILEDLLLAFSLPVFARRAKRRLIAHPKSYFFDVGVYRTIRPQGILDSMLEIEGLVAQHLRSWTLAQSAPHSLSFWRTQTQLELDFIIYGPRGFWAIEVKRSLNLGPDDVRGLAAFQEEYPEAKCCFVVMGKRREEYRGFPVYPLEQFLLGINPENLIF